ncbi:hypothetical protein [Sphingopyxis sp. PET50]|uniref:hypothetical protein n=1 Tax=Sphingopyxis sp. PET50 TaxID=2976533 RepID=UPI0021AEBE5F|nr:hypothetical protein [Sphingopyxis sp. PET50]
MNEFDPELRIDIRGRLKAHGRRQLVIARMSALGRLGGRTAPCDRPAPAAAADVRRDRPEAVFAELRDLLYRDDDVFDLRPGFGR